MKKTKLRLQDRAELISALSFFLILFKCKLIFFQWIKDNQGDNIWAGDQKSVALMKGK